MLRRVLSLFRRHVARELNAIGTEVRRISRPSPERSAVYRSTHDQLRAEVQSAARKVGCSTEAA